MKIFYLIAMTFVMFGMLLFFKSKGKYSVIYCLAIGGVVNANFFNAIDYPIKCFGMSFGVDSVIYTLFIFCIIVMYYFYGYKQAVVLLICSVSAILFSAVSELLAGIASTGYSYEMLSRFLKFIISIVASLIAIYVMLIILNKFKNKLNIYISICIGMIVASIINSIIYFGGGALLDGGFIEHFSSLLIPSIIGKAFSAMFALLIFYFLSKQFAQEQVGNN